MFVLKNAWAALGRVKWRTALIALLHYWCLRLPWTWQYLSRRRHR